MNTAFRFAPLFSLFFIAGLFGSCEGQPQQGVARDIDAEELKTLLSERQDVLLLDVRTDMEWNAGHIAGAARIDFLEDDFSAIAHALPKNQPIALYCAAGGRSEDAMNNMAKAGFTELYNLRGGFFGWEDAGENVSFEAPALLPKSE